MPAPLTSACAFPLLLRLGGFCSRRHHLRSLGRIFAYSIWLFIVVYLVVAIIMSYYYQGDNFNRKCVTVEEIHVTHETKQSRLEHALSAGARPFGWSTPFRLEHALFGPLGAPSSPLARSPPALSCVLSRHAPPALSCVLSRHARPFPALGRLCSARPQPFAPPPFPRVQSFAIPPLVLRWHSLPAPCPALTFADL